MREHRQIMLDPPPIPVEAPPPPEPDRGMLDQLEHLVREVYVLCYREFSGDPYYGREPIPEWDGGEDKYGKNHRRKWPGVVQTILTLEADPMLYIKAQFALAVSNRPPRPNQLCSPHAAATWEQYRSQVTAQLGRQLEANRQALRASADPMIAALGWAEDRAVRYCLNSTSMANLTPLFRYCLGSTMGWQEVTARFRERALLQYVFQKSVYDQSWGSFVPLELQHAAMELRRGLAGGS